MAGEDLAEEFLRQLPNVRRGELTAEDQKCCICMEPFGTTPSERGIIERPKRLPCDHIVGSECINKWVSPDFEDKHSCPVCRYKLYEAHPGPCIHQDEIEEPEDPMDVEEAANGVVEEVEASEAGDAGVELRLTLTRTFEEFMLYRLLVDTNAQLPLKENGMICPLNTNQEAELLWALSQRQAFDQPHSMGGEEEAQMSDKEMWEQMRHEGYYYKPDYHVEESGRGGGWFTHTYRLRESDSTSMRCAWLWDYRVLRI